MEPTVSINIGARQLQHAGFMADLQERLAMYPQVRPANLELEILETSALADMDRASAVMRSCVDMGVQFAVDDFGTGYSSLTYLKRLPAATLKIDQSFVRDMLVDKDDLAIVKGVIGLATAFQRKVIAEGVETVQHGLRLLELGCDCAQGFGIARPMPAEAVPLWLAQWKPDPLWRTPMPAGV
jgi:EAL domain-containing protein (putative c-di-GMP-specific phosphodiesterase class I)